MANVGLILLVFAFVTACISIFVPVIRNMSMLSMAVAFWIAAELLGGVGRVFH